MKDSDKWKLRRLREMVRENILFQLHLSFAVLFKKIKICLHKDKLLFTSFVRIINFTAARNNTMIVNYINFMFNESKCYQVVMRLPFVSYFEKYHYILIVNMVLIFTIYII